jgi:hypothetical protein
MTTSAVTKGTTRPMNHSHTRRRSILAIAAALTAVLLAACGSSPSSTSSTASSSSAAAATAGGLNRTKLVACLKQHGVTLPARPAGARRRTPGAGGYGGYGGGAPGVFGGGGAGAGRAGAGGPFANNPKFRAALQACGGGAFRGRRTSLNHAAVTKFAACVGRHGYKLPAPNFSGTGPVFPAKIATDKKFQAASRACASLLRPTAPGSGSGTSAGSAGSASGTTTS